MRYIASLLLALLWCAPAYAGQVACNGTDHTGAVTLCNSGQSYGCTGSAVSNQILAVDGNRTSIWIQNNGTSNLVANFGDSVATATNGLIIYPGSSLIWSNMPQGNTPGRVNTNNINILAQTGGTVACVFMFTQ